MFKNVSISLHYKTKYYILSGICKQKTNNHIHTLPACIFQSCVIFVNTFWATVTDSILPSTEDQNSRHCSLLPEGKYPEPTYRSSYIRHKVSRIFRAKQSAKTGVGSSLIMDRRDRFRSSYHEQFQYRWYPCPQSAEKQQIQYPSVVMGDREKTVDKQTTYFTSFGQSGDHSSTEFKECLLPKINKSRPINLREVPEDKWTTNSSEEFRAHKCGPIHLERRCPTLSCVFKGETLTGEQQRLSTTNQCFFPKINRSQFPVHVDGASIRTLSSIEFGRPDLVGSFYSTATQEQFPPKEVVHPKPPVYPPSHVLFEQGTFTCIFTMKRPAHITSHYTLRV
uniref:Si:dkey-13m1.5 n=1 Tax=Sinocyclocheilus grahami TaxID=75366 RepID=A0A672R9T4_SINGR